MNAYESLSHHLRSGPQAWPVISVAGFLGSNLLEALLKLDRRAVGLENFSTGYQRNLDEIRTLATPEQWANFQFTQGDIRNRYDCRNACKSVDYALYQAAFGSVPCRLQIPSQPIKTTLSAS